MASIKSHYEQSSEMASDDLASQVASVIQHEIQNLADVQHMGMMAMLRAMHESTASSKATKYVKPHSYVQPPKQPAHTNPSQDRQVLRSTVNNTSRSKASVVPKAVAIPLLHLPSLPLPVVQQSSAMQPPMLPVQLPYVTTGPAFQSCRPRLPSAALSYPVANQEQRPFKLLTLQPPEAPKPPIGTTLVQQHSEALQRQMLAHHEVQRYTARYLQQAAQQQRFNKHKADKALHKTRKYTLDFEEKLQLEGSDQSCRGGPQQTSPTLNNTAHTCYTEEFLSEQQQLSKKVGSVESEPHQSGATDVGFDKPHFFPLSSPQKSSSSSPCKGARKAAVRDAATDPVLLPGLPRLTELVPAPGIFMDLRYPDHQSIESNREVLTARNYCNVIDMDEELVAETLQDVSEKQAVQAMTDQQLQRQSYAALHLNFVTTMVEETEEKLHKSTDLSPRKPTPRSPRKNSRLLVSPGRTPLNSRSDPEVARQRELRADYIASTLVGRGPQQNEFRIGIRQELADMDHKLRAVEKLSRQVDQEFRGTRLLAGTLGDLQKEEEQVANELENLSLQQTKDAELKNSSPKHPQSRSSTIHLQELRSKETARVSVAMVDLIEELSEPSGQITERSVEQLISEFRAEAKIDEKVMADKNEKREERKQRVKQWMREKRQKSFENYRNEIDTKRELEKHPFLTDYEVVGYGHTEEQRRELTERDSEKRKHTIVELLTNILQEQPPKPVNAKKMTSNIHKVLKQSQFPEEKLKNVSSYWKGSDAFSPTKMQMSDSVARTTERINSARSKQSRQKRPIQATIALRTRSQSPKPSPRTTQIRQMRSFRELVRVQRPEVTRGRSNRKQAPHLAHHVSSSPSPPPPRIPVRAQRPISAAPAPHRSLTYTQRLQQLAPSTSHLFHKPKIKVVNRSITNGLRPRKSCVYGNHVHNDSLSRRTPELPSSDILSLMPQPTSSKLSPRHSRPAPYAIRSRKSVNSLWTVDANLDEVLHGSLNSSTLRRLAEGRTSYLEKSLYSLPGVPKSAGAGSTLLDSDVYSDQVVLHQLTGQETMSQSSETSLVIDWDAVDRIVAEA